MAWTPKAKETAGWMPPAGVEWREYSDEAFSELERSYDAQFEQKGGLRRFFEHVRVGLVLKGTCIPKMPKGNYQKVISLHTGDEGRVTGEKAGGARRERR